MTIAAIHVAYICYRSVGFLHRSTAYATHKTKTPALLKSNLTTVNTLRGNPGVNEMPNRKMISPRSLTLSLFVLGSHRVYASLTPNPVECRLLSHNSRDKQASCPLGIQTSNILNACTHGPWMMRMPQKYALINTGHTTPSGKGNRAAQKFGGTLKNRATEKYIFQTVHKPSVFGAKHTLQAGPRKYCINVRP